MHIVNSTTSADPRLMGKGIYCMKVHSAQDLFSQRLGDIHSSSCFLAQHIPSMVSSAQNDELRKLLNLYLDVVRDNADCTQAALQSFETSKSDLEPTAVPAMVDDLFDLIERIKDPALIDVAILFSSNEIGIYEAHRFNLLSDFADLLGKKSATHSLRKGEQSLNSICEKLKAMIRSSAVDLPVN